MKSKIRIGTCGFRTNKIEYGALLSAVEIQQTFYQPPQIKTLERWREAMPEDFEFTLKAWQLITHEAKSPTYKRLKKQLTDTERAEAGRFQPTAIVREAWDVTHSCAAALGAQTVLFQCPASFKPYSENIENLENFFASIDRGSLNLAWEPRGDWSDQTVREICDRHRLWHAVDPFKQITVTPERCYYRLHGVTGWRYKYETGELEELVTLLPSKNELAYVFFNNIEMTDDALRFQEIVKNY